MNTVSDYRAIDELYICSFVKTLMTTHLSITDRLHVANET